MEIIETLQDIDEQVMVWLNYDGTTLTDRFWFAFSYKWTWIGANLAILLTFIFRQWPNWRKLLLLILMTALIITLCDQISSSIIKPWAARLRPSHNPEIQHLLYYVNDYHGGRYGFVSSHAANSVGICVWLCKLFAGRIFRWTTILWTICHCYSRIYLGVHYLGDLLGGTIIGLLVGFGGYALYTWLDRRWAMPAFAARHHTATTPRPVWQQRLFDARNPWLIIGAVWLTSFILFLLALR